MSKSGFIPEVDVDACQGHALCRREAPEVFDVGPDGLAFAKLEFVEGDQLPRARAAEAECPEMAISLLPAPSA